jgi:hypothetical protein
MKRSTASIPWWPPLIAAVVLSLATVFVLIACATTPDAPVGVTADRDAVEDCESRGPVVLGTGETEFDARMNALRRETARQGGNVLLVTSYATATGGTAYRCEAIDPPPQR